MTFERLSIVVTLAGGLIFFIWRLVLNMFYLPLRSSPDELGFTYASTIANAALVTAVIVLFIAIFSAILAASLLIAKNFVLPLLIIIALAGVVSFGIASLFIWIIELALRLLLVVPSTVLLTVLAVLIIESMGTAQAFRPVRPPWSVRLWVAALLVFVTISTAPRGTVSVSFVSALIIVSVRLKYFDSTSEAFSLLSRIVKKWMAAYPEPDSPRTEAAAPSSPRRRLWEVLSRRLEAAQQEVDELIDAPETLPDRWLRVSKTLNTAMDRLAARAQNLQERIQRTRAEMRQGFLGLARFVFGVFIFLLVVGALLSFTVAPRSAYQLGRSVASGATYYAPEAPEENIWLSFFVPPVRAEPVQVLWLSGTSVDSGQGPPTEARLDPLRHGQCLLYLGESEGKFVLYQINNVAPEYGRSFRVPTEAVMLMSGKEVNEHCVSRGRQVQWPIPISEWWRALFEWIASSTDPSS